MEIYNLFLFHFEQSIRSFCARERVDFAELLLFCELSFHSGHQRTRSFVRSMQRLMQYQSVFNMMWSFAQDGPPPYTFRQQSVSSRVIGNFGTSQLVGFGQAWERRIHWLTGSMHPPTDSSATGGSGQQRGGGAFEEDEDNAFLLSFFAFRRAKSHWEEHDRLAKLAAPEPVFTAVEYVSDDEEEMDARDVPIYLRRLYREAKIGLDDLEIQSQWAEAWVAAAGGRGTKGAWKLYARRRQDAERVRVMQGADIMQRFGGELWRWRRARMLRAWCLCCQRKEIALALDQVLERATQTHCCAKLLRIWREEGKEAAERASNAEVQEYVAMRGGAGGDKRLMAALTLRPSRPKAPPPQQWTLVTPPPLDRSHAMWDLLRVRSEEEEEEELLAALEAGLISTVDMDSREEFLRQQASRKVNLDVLEEVTRGVVAEMATAGMEAGVREVQEQWEGWARRSCLRRVKIAACGAVPEIAGLLGKYGPEDLGMRGKDEVCMHVRMSHACSHGIHTAMH